MNYDSSINLLNNSNTINLKYYIVLYPNNKYKSLDLLFNLSFILKILMSKSFDITITKDRAIFCSVLCNCYECWPQCLESAVWHLLLNYTKLKKENRALCGLQAYIYSGTMPNNMARSLC